jgi:hypothetical protein
MYIKRLQDQYRQYFKVPVDPEAQLTVRIAKDASGDVPTNRYISYVTSTNAPQIRCKSFTIKSGCYFTLDFRGRDGRMLDISSIEGGWGIYHYPTTETGGKTYELPEKLGMVYALDPKKAEVIDFKPSKDESELLLLTKEDASYMVTVIDASSFTEKQKLRVFSAEDEKRVKGLLPDENGLFIYGQNTIAVLVHGDEGYRLSYTVKTPDGFTLYPDDRLFALSGDKLAVCSPDYDDDSFMLTVFNRTEMTFFGQYINKNNKSAGLSENVQADVEAEPFSVAWS